MSRRKRLRAAIDRELGHLHKTHELLLAIQFAANHDCEFDASDALAVICKRVMRSIERLDQATLDAVAAADARAE